MRLTDKVTLKHLQDTQPWTVPYSIHMTSAPAGVVHDRMGAHVVLHAAKTVGKLAAIFESIDHTGEPTTAGQCRVIRDMSADLVTEAMRLANLYGFDLAAAVVERSEEKNGVTLPAWPGQETPPNGPEHFDIVFDRQPGPEAPGFVEIETPARHGIKLGEWVQRQDLWWAIRITKADVDAYFSGR